MGGGPVRKAVEGVFSSHSARLKDSRHNCSLIGSSRELEFTPKWGKQGRGQNEWEM